MHHLGFIWVLPTPEELRQRAYYRSVQQHQREMQARVDLLNYRLSKNKRCLYLAQTDRNFRAGLEYFIEYGPNYDYAKQGFPTLWDAQAYEMFRSGYFTGKRMWEQNETPPASLRHRLYLVFASRRKRMGLQRMPHGV